MSVLWVLLAVLAAADNVLVVLDSWDIKDTHASFLAWLTSQGHSLVYRMADSQHLKLEKYGEFSYEHIVLAAASAEGRLTEEAFLRFYDEGKGNLFVLGDTDAAQPYRRLANAFGLDFYEQGARVYAGSKPYGPALVHGNFTAITSSFSKPLSFAGTGFHIRRGHKSAFPLLTGTKDARVLNELKQKEVLKPEGEEVVLAVALQGLNNARVVFLGSSDLCSNSTFEGPNGKFCKETALWTFQQKGKLRYGNITHHRIQSLSDTQRQPLGYLEVAYRVQDFAYYSIDIEEFKEGRWQAYTGKTVYVEFVMLDPYIRKYLSRTGKTFYTTFQIPDVYGVFQFKAKSEEPGFSWLSTASEAPVRPFRHDEYERFLVVAYPYYASVFACVGSFLVFSFYFLYHKE